MKEIVTAYKDKGDKNGVKQVQSTGLHVGGERYIVLKADERSLYGKKVRHPFMRSHARQRRTAAVQTRCAESVLPTTIVEF